MTFIQLISIQLLLIIVSHQILADPILAEESSDGLLDRDQNMVKRQDYMYFNLGKFLADTSNRENSQHVYDKVAKRRAQAKANLAGLWGVPTRFA
ncbi:unnamed protein product [Rotaria magnacalcarata]|uniref:Uncharacterized protein n=1 Tax=Rotaria magnacalcarata TaxID=392030 RepID=A0A816GCD0_9BILA|nr:unnamed protein product [Rotaria magnacalcarata]CAF1673346.1 unnamed protein product [Rotaria magnacalcarata]CAF1927874.1 unnamed protein product [Rotaria magnacalcarata]CAF2150142.1 unnamed protein product [Rotaria magnacalcarata]CAF2205883.1 unnamed protein product [Rotaria magnacalcarata]